MTVKRQRNAFASLRTPCAGRGSEGVSLKAKVFIPILIVAALAGEGYYHFVYLPRHRPPLAIAYVMPRTLEVLNTPAQVRVRVATLDRHDMVEIVNIYGPWREIRLPGGNRGWVRADGLMDSSTYHAGQLLATKVGHLTAQAAGHTLTQMGLRVEPSRRAPLLAELRNGQVLRIFGRRVVGPASLAPMPSEVWYLVQAGAMAGWVRGRLVSLDIPPAISMYAEDVNLVAWITLQTVPDDGREVPEYLTADRGYEAPCDFTHIRVFTWSVKTQQYVTAYVRGGLCGFFPITTEKKDGVPYFWLRLKDAKGREYEQAYKMLDTIVRPAGIIEGWGPSAAPAAYHALASMRARRRMQPESLADRRSPLQLRERG